MKSAIPRTNQNVEIKTATAIPKDIGSDVILVEENLNMNVVDIEVIMADEVNKIKPKVLVIFGHLLIKTLLYILGRTYNRN